MEDMNRIIERFKRLRILVVGDAMRDIYHFGRVDRISPEAPVPVFVEERREFRRGGAANVAHQLEVWGFEVETFFAIRRSDKHRYLVGSHQLFRHDEDSTEKPGDQLICEGFQAIVLSDYAKGFLTPCLCRQIILEAECPVIVDPKGTDWEKYKGATVICPNEREMDLVCADGVYRWDGDLALKKGAKGIALYDQYGTCVETIPAHSVPVFDVTGAGDTVVAMIAAGLAAGADLRTSAIMANAAASVVVQKVGTSVCTLEELKCALGLPQDVSTLPTAATGISSESANGSAITSLSPSTMTPTANE